MRWRRSAPSSAAAPSPAARCSARSRALPTRSTARRISISTMWLRQRLELVQDRAYREIAVVEQHVAGHAVIQEPHPDLVIRLVGVGRALGREKGEAHAPRGARQQWAPHLGLSGPGLARL